MFKRLPFLPALVVLPLLAACAGTSDPADLYLGGAGDPIRGAALNAPFQFGDLPSQRGQPARVARSVAQLEYLTRRLSEDLARQSDFNGTTLLQLQLGQAEARRAFGIAPRAPSREVEGALRRAARALEGLNPDGARAALSGPNFPEGGAVVLQRLAEPPALPQAAAAAAAVNNDIMNRRFDRSSRRHRRAPIV
ncbi:hypothetical protein EBE87_17730 [Pseudoroseomonas wenyumeiae]|uniref:DUF3035 domain-containing protein n=1 Tax=Teichococcus wenyumeiae TaxID=2478470 RepID=A0A3A9JCD5_9PROT|nr:hypothetical protein [Pseudoroseomonas wenyumeiae]RKK01084.1 hypothetical protein D6Z83_26875 [Pseudoroseomonas wenyumeiae]RMI19996.1 hypothetical protein EBE87_17730 [Pseudoroseomonas wenyumeiae]